MRDVACISCAHRFRDTSQRSERRTGEPRSDDHVSWGRRPTARPARRAAGRMVRTQTVLEAAVKTICTTNVAWSATVRMVNALVDNLGEKAIGGARAFPTAEAMASVPESFYREVVRAGYRSAYLHALASGVVAGTLEVEELGLQADLPH